MANKLLLQGPKRNFDLIELPSAEMNVCISHSKLHQVNAAVVNPFPIQSTCIFFSGECGIRDSTALLKSVNRDWVDNATLSKTGGLTPEYAQVINHTYSCG